MMIPHIKYYDYLPAGSHPNSYTYAMYFSYDIAGNVKTLTRDYPGWKESGQEFKRVDYDYDLVSGKVNVLSYNRGFADQYFQEYDYDADNRLTKVESSADGLIWRKDAGYDYYQHGPLARMTLGDQYVQGVDYAYTIQGWLKAVNSDLLNPAKDMGRDGSNSSPGVEANDAMGFSIDYFKGDYRPIGTDSVTHLPRPSRNLYNGNIARSSMALLPFDNLDTRYTYDQLNRIMRADYANVSKTGGLTNTAKYYSSYGYDPDGNLQKLVRNGGKSTLQMDSLVYHYTAAPLYNNQLQNVNDYAADNYDNDIRKNTVTGVSRYMYDPTGNVIKDLVSGQDTIEWNHYNKVTKALKDTSGNGLMFAYDGAGNRYLKAVTSVSGDTTKYDQEYEVRDAQGNVLAVYKGQSVYKGGQKAVWVNAILTDIYRAVGVPTTISDLIVPVYAEEGHFRNSFISGAFRVVPDWAMSEIGSEPVSWYLTHNDAVRVNMLGRTGDYPDFYSAMAQTNMGDGVGSILGTSLDSLFTADKDMFHGFLRFALTPGAGGSEAAQGEMLSKLCNEPSVIGNIMYQLGLRYDEKNCAGNVSQLQSYIAENGTDLMADTWYTIGHGDPKDFFDYLDDFATDTALMGSSSGFTGPKGVLLPIFQQALTEYCPGYTLAGFMANWPSAQVMLMNTNDPESLLGIVYDDDPNSLIESYVNDAGGLGAIPGALAAIPELTPSSLVHAGEVHLDWYHSQDLYQQILKYQRIWLASHVLYGSSRLGTKDYLPEQLYSLMDYEQAQPVIDSSVLNGRRPWYSAKYNDDIQSQPTIPWGYTQTEPFGASERTGEKQYELTNQLGNVQVTVSDNRYAVADESTDTIQAYHPVIKSAYDYYPFGMLMPGRYVSDTSEHCVTISRPSWAWKEVTVACWDVLAWVWPDYTRVGEGAAVVNGDAVEINAPNAGDAVSFDFPVTIGLQQELDVDIERVSLNSSASIQIKELQGKDWVTLAETPINVVSGGIKIPFMPTTNTIRVVWNGKILVWVRKACISGLEWVEDNQLVTICDEDKDKYRFGFNGKEKVNEWAGIGNYYDYGMRGVDPRIGRFISVDPLTAKFPMLTPFQYASNRPIASRDIDGLEAEDLPEEGLEDLRDPAGAEARENLKEPPPETRTPTELNKDLEKGREALEKRLQRESAEKDPLSGVKPDPLTKLQKAEAKLEWNRLYPSVKDPLGRPDAEQSPLPEAMKVREEVKEGQPVYRLGTRGKSNEGPEAQFWSPIDPRVDPEGFAKSLNIPKVNVEKADFVEKAQVNSFGTFVTRPASNDETPGAGNSGKAIEVVVPWGGTMNNEIIPFKR